MTSDTLLRQGHRAELYLTGSFLWGRALTPPEDMYDVVQAELLSHLRHDGGRGWDAGVRGLDDPTLVRYAMDGSGNLAVPLFLLLCRGDDLVERVAAAIAADPDSTSALSAPDRHFDWRCTSAQITFGEVGTATLRVGLELTALSDVSTRGARSEIELCAASLAEPLAYVVRGTSEEFSAAVNRLSAIRPEQPWWYLGTVDPEQQLAQRNQLLWLHRVVVLTAPEERHERLTQQGTALLPSTYRVHRYGEVVVVPGISTSMVVKAPEDSRLQSVLDMIDLQYAHYALTAELDRALFVRLRSLQTDRSQAPGSFDGEASSIAAVLDRVNVHRADIDTMLVDFGGGSIELWEVVSAVSRQDHLDRSVDRKLSALAAAYRTRIDRAAARRQHRLDSLAFLFASLTLTTSVIAAVEFSFGGPSEGPVRVRILVLVASLTLLVLLLLLYARLSRQVRRQVELGDGRAARA